MQDTQAAQNRVLALPSEAQAGYLAACIAHVAEAFDRVAGLRQDVLESVIEPSLSALWSVAARQSLDADAIARVQDDADRIAAELAEELSSDLQHLVFAAALAVEGLPGPRANTKQVLNNLDEVVRYCDPKGELGTDEEGVWRDDLLLALERRGIAPPITRDAVSTELATVTEWERRWSADFNR